MRWCLALAVASSATVALIAAPAGAQSSDEQSSTDVSFEVTPPGSAGIVLGQVDPSAVPKLGRVQPTPGKPVEITGDLPAMEVSGPEGSAGNWSVSIQMTGPFDAGAGKVPADRALAYLAGEPIQTDDMYAEAYALTKVKGVNLGTGGELIGGTVGPNGGTVTYTPRVTVTIPPATPSGTYTGTIVQTVSVGS